MDELQFVQRCIRKEPPALDQFVEKYSSLVYHSIYAVLRTTGKDLPPQSAEDIFQEIFLSLFKDNCWKLKSFQAKNGCSLATWLRHVTVHATIDHLRKTKPLLSLEAEDEEGFSLKEFLPDNSASVRERVTEEEKLQALRECIQRLTSEEKYFLELHIYREMSLEKLKDHFKLSRSAMDMRKERIFGKLKDCFQAKNFLLDL